MKPDYPEVLERGVRRLRRWRVALNSPGPAAEDLEQFGVFCQKAIEMVRRTAFANLGRDLTLFKPTVTVVQHGSTDYEVNIEYDPKGAVGDCELLALWSPIRIMHALWGVKELQGAERSLWRPMLPL